MPSEYQEIWKVYPEFPFIEVSNLGGVRTIDHFVVGKDRKRRLIKGHILKQQFTQKGYLQVEFSVDGKTIHRKVHRMVAITFISNPNNYPEINHKDCNPKNNAVSNLEWCTHQYNNAYKEKFGKSPAEVSGRPVFAINLRTLEILYFESQAEAARETGVSNQLINAVIHGRKKTAGGFWFTENESEITEEKLREIKASMRSYPIIAINLDTFEVLRFESQSEAARQLSINKGNISSVIRGDRNRVGGYWFYYADENAVEKVRSKFGNEVAREVERLMCES